MTRHIRTLFATPVVLLAVSVWVYAQKSADPAKPTASAATSTRVCAKESGVNVCRNQEPAAPQAPVAAEVVQTPEDSSVRPGRLLVLQDIPSDIVERLADDPENNRKYHPRQSWDYRDAESARPASGSTARSLQLTEADVPAWQYRPTESFDYRAKESWTYDPDLFSRLWQQNIVHDTRIIEIETDTPGVILVPVQSAR